MPAMMDLMTKRNLIIGALILAVPVLVVAWWLGSPLFIDQTVSEDFPMAAGAVIPDDMTEEEVATEMEEAAAAADIETSEPMPEMTDPVVLAEGLFNGADAFHEGSGRATVYELEDGSEVLRFEAFEVTNGPDLHVYLVPDPNPEDRSEVAGYVDLGRLKGNVGNQNYEIPADVNISEFGSVVIYCQPFHVIFATATLG